MLDNSSDDSCSCVMMINDEGRSDGDNEDDNKMMK